MEGKVLSYQFHQTEVEPEICPGQLKDQTPRASKCMLRNSRITFLALRGVAMSEVEARECSDKKSTSAFNEPRPSNKRCQNKHLAVHHCSPHTPTSGMKNCHALDLNRNARLHYFIVCRKKKPQDALSKCLLGNFRHPSLRGTADLQGDRNITGHSCSTASFRPIQLNFKHLALLFFTCLSFFLPMSPTFCALNMPVLHLRVLL